MAEIEKSNLDWFNALPLEQQEIFNKSYPTDEEKIAWNNMGQPFVYESLHYDTDNPKGEFFDPWGAMTNIRDIPTKMVNFQINPTLGSFGEIPFERNTTLKQFKEDPNPENWETKPELFYDLKTIPGYFFPPTAAFVAGLDIAEGIDTWRPEQVALSALGISKISKPLQLILASGGIAGMPTEVEGITISKALEYLKKLPISARGEPLKYSANQVLKRLEMDGKNPGGVGPNQWRAIREHLEEIDYPVDEIQNSEKVLDDIQNNTWMDDIETKTIPNPHGDGEISITKYTPEKVLNKKTEHNAKLSTKDSELHLDSNVKGENSKGVIAHTIFKIDGPNLNVLEAQNDAQAAIAITGHKGTEKNDNWMIATKKLWDYIYLDKIANGGDSVMPRGADIMAGQGMPKEKFNLIVNHPTFDSKSFEKWKLANPKNWKIIEGELNTKGFILTKQLYNNLIEVDAFGNVLQNKKFTGFDDFEKKMNDIDPGESFTPNPETGMRDINIREAPYKTPLNDPNKPEPWVQEEFSKILDDAANNPNIERVILPQEKDLVARWGRAGEKTVTMLKSLYAKTIPKVLNKMKIPITKNEKFTYSRKSGDDPFYNLLDIYGTEGNVVRTNWTDDPLGPVIMRNRDGVPGGIERALSLINGVDNYVYQKNLWARDDISIPNQLDNYRAAQKNGFGDEFLNQLEEFGSEIVRVKPESEKAVETILDIYRAVDFSATRTALEKSFADGGKLNKLEELVKKNLPISESYSTTTFTDVLNNYSDAYALALEKAYKNLPKDKLKILEDSGVIKKEFARGDSIEMTPELRDKITQEGIFRN